MITPDCETMMIRPVRQLVCSCCRLPFARIQNGTLIVESHHHGQKHVNCLPLQDVVQLIRQAGALSEER